MKTPASPAVMRATDVDRADWLAANAAYHRQHRAEHPERRERDRKTKGAYYRALTRLRDRYPGEFQQLYFHERHLDGPRDDAPPETS